MQVRWKKGLGYVLAALMPALMGLSWYRQSYYVNNRPERPDPASGQIVSLNVHGTTVYLTRFEYAMAEYAFYVGILSGLAGGAILQRKGAA